MKIRYGRVSWLSRGFLMSIIHGQNFKIGCELGTYKCGTSFFLLDHIPDLTIHTVDIFERQPEHEDYKKDAYDLKDTYPILLEKAKKYDGRLIIHKGWTHEVAKDIEDESLDYVFVDADHTYEGCKRDILSWRQKLKPGGFMMGHDIHLPSVQKAVVECCKSIHVNKGACCWVGEL